MSDKLAQKRVGLKSDFSSHAMRYPSLTKRLMAMVYESLLLFGVLMLFGGVFAVLTGQNHGLKFHWQLQVYLFFVLGLYFVWFWTQSGQTLAMKTWRIRLVNIDGHPVTWPQAICRYMCSWMWVVPPIAAIHYGQLTQKPIEVMGLVILWIVVVANVSRWLPQQQFVSDLLCRTRLIVVD